MLNLPACRLVINADFGSDENKAVLTLPELDHPVLVCIVELAAHCVVIKNDERGANVIKLVEAEVALPRILVGVINILFRVVFIAEEAL